MNIMFGVGLAAAGELFFLDRAGTFVFMGFQLSRDLSYYVEEEWTQPCTQNTPTASDFDLMP